VPKARRKGPDSPASSIDLLFLVENTTGEGFLPGSSIKATIFFDIQQEVSAAALVASFSGQETTRVTYTRQVRQGDHTVTLHETAHASRNLVQSTIPIDASSMIQNGKVGPGSYAIPVEIQLPGGLPGSMHGSSGGSDCSIRYNLHAQLMGSGWIQDYKASQEIRLVAHPLPNDPVPYNGQPVKENVNFCCCFNRGHMIFGAQVSDTAIGRGEPVTISMSCRNRTTVPIESVVTTLSQTISWSARGHSAQQTTTLAARDFGKFRGLERIQSLSLIKELSVGRDMQDIARDLEEANYTATIVMPSTAQDTLAGSLIRVDHVLTVVVNTGSCITKPTIVIPIQAGPSPTPTSSHPPPSAPLQQGEPEIVFDFSSAMTSPTVCVPSTHALMGGAAYDKEDGEEDIAVAPFPSTGEPRSASVDNLLLDMNESIHDYGLIKEKLGNPDWQPVFQTLSPSNFGTIIQKVDLDFDQAKVAELMAFDIGDFRCDHVVAAIAKCSDWNRATVVEKLLPFCKDLPQNKDKILNVLSDWDKTVTQRAFDKALS
jgi:hypothetical protein